MIKFLKLNIAVKIETAVDESGRGVWRASSDSLRITADGQSPDDALRILKDAILNAERANAQDFRVAKFDVKRNVSEIAREEEVEEAEKVVKKKRGRPKKVEVMEDGGEDETSDKESIDLG